MSGVLYTCRYGAKLIIAGEMTGGDMLVVSTEYVYLIFTLRLRDIIMLL